MDSEIGKVFKYFDKDSSGYLDAAELGDALRCLGLSPSKSQIDDLMQKADQNSDRKLTLNEFTRMYHEIKVDANVTLEDLIREFKEFDRDNSGTISLSELDEILCSQGEPLSKDEVRELLNDFDKNRDGKVSIVELATGLLAR